MSPKCRHDWLRCIHGDEILARGGRSCCVDCGKVFATLLTICSVTGSVHRSYQ